MAEKDPTQMSEEEIVAELAALNQDIDSLGATHTRSDPQEHGPFAAQQAWQETGPIDKALAIYGKGAHRALTQGLNMVPQSQGFRDWVKEKSGVYNLASNDQDLLDADMSGPNQVINAAPFGQIGSMIGEATTEAPMVMGGEAALARVPGIGAALTGGALRRSVTQGAIQGAIMAPPGEKGSGALWGGGAGLAVPLMLRGAKAAVYGVGPTADAQALLNKGVDLTPRQMNPKSWLAKMQNVMNDVPLLGQHLRNVEKSSFGQFQDALIQDVAPPGVQLTPGLPLAPRLDEAYRAFEPAYLNGAKGFDLYPTVYNTSGRNVHLRADMQNTMRGIERIDPSTQRKVSKFVEDKMQGLKPQPNGLIRSDDLLSTRSKIRDAIRVESKKNGAGDSLDQIRMLEAAEDKLTAVLESQLPPEPLAALKATDLQYAKYKVVEDAVSKAKGKPLTVNHLREAVAAAAGKSRTARGHGLLRDWSDAAAEMFDTKEPSLGSGLAHLSLPALAAWTHPAATAIASAPFILAAATKTGRRIAGGMTKPQKIAQKAGDSALRALESAAGRLTTPVLETNARSALLPHMPGLAQPIRQQLEDFNQSPVEPEPIPSSISQQLEDLIRRASSAQSDAGDISYPSYGNLE